MLRFMYINHDIILFWIIVRSILNKDTYSNNQIIAKNKNNNLYYSRITFVVYFRLDFVGEFLMTAYTGYP